MGKNRKVYVYRLLKKFQGVVCVGGKWSPFSCISQNSILEKCTLHKIQSEKNELFIKLNVRKTDFSQNSMPEKLTFHKANYISMKNFLLNTLRNGKKSALNRKKSQIWPLFCKIITYLCKKIGHFKKYQLQGKFIFGN